MRRGVRFGLLAAGSVALATAWWGQRLLEAGPDRLSGLPLLLGGALLVAVALRVAGLDQPPAPRVTRPSWLSWELVAAVVVFGLGTWLRLARFSEVPEGLNHDAAWNGMYATYIRRGGEFTPYTAAAWGRETLFMYVIALFQTFYGATMEAVQAAATAVGLLALVPMYLLVRDLFGRVAGIAGFAFFAVSGWHWVFSRVGWRCITVPPFEILALLGLWRALTGGRKSAWVVAGAFTAASLYTYNAGRGVPLVIGGLVVLWAVTERARWRELLAGCLWAGGGFLVVGGPMLWYAANNWIKFQGRAAHLLGGRSEEYPVLVNLGEALAMFHYQGNGNDFFVSEPLLEPVAAVLLLVGAVLLLSRLSTPQARFVVVGFALSLLPGVLSIPNGNRCITAMPFVYAAIGYAGAALYRSCASLPALGQGLGAGLALLLALQGTSEVYARYLGPKHPPLRGISVGATAAGEFLHDYGSDYRVYSVSETWPQYTLLYLGYTHGSPLQPPMLLGRSFDEIEGQLSRFGRKGLVMVTDQSRAARAARAGIARLYAEAEEVPIKARRLGGATVGQAMVVDPRSASRTALWSNLSRVVAVAAAAETPAAGALCHEAVPTKGGISMRLRVMVPEKPAAAVAIRIGPVCSDDASQPAVELSLSASGLAIATADGASLIAGAGLEAGRWYDLGFVADSDGNARALIDGRPVALGRWENRPAVFDGVAIEAVGMGERPLLYLDDYGVLSHAVSDESPWWRGGEVPHAKKQVFFDFEGIPLGPLAGRPGWRAEGTEWRTLAGPGDATGGAGGVDAENAFDGGKGNTAGRFDEPMGIGADAAGNLYVSERLNHRVQKFAADGTYLGEWGRLGNKPGEFREPLDVAVEGDRVYVMDTWNTRIQIFDLDGNYVRQIGPDPILGKPRGIFVRDGRVYVANSGRGNILVFGADGELELQFPKEDEPKLRQVVDLVVDSQGRVYVNNSQLNRLEVFDAEGRRLDPIPIAGWETPNLKEFYMAIDDDDLIYVSDWDLRRVRRVRTDGEELAPIGPKMDRPSGMVVGNGRLVIVSRGDSVLRVAEIEP